MYAKLIIILLLVISPVKAQHFYTLFGDKFNDSTLPAWNIIGPDYVETPDKNVSVRNGAVISPRTNIFKQNYRIAFDATFASNNEGFFIGTRADDQLKSIGFYISSAYNQVNFVNDLPNRKPEILHSLYYTFDTNRVYRFAIRDDGEFISLFIDDQPVMMMVNNDRGGQWTFIKSYGDKGIIVDNYSIMIATKINNFWSVIFGKKINTDNPPIKPINPIYRVTENSSIFFLLLAGFCVLVLVKSVTKR